MQADSTAPGGPSSPWQLCGWILSQKKGALNINKADEEIEREYVWFALDKCVLERNWSDLHGNQFRAATNESTCTC